MSRKAFEICYYGQYPAVEAPPTVILTCPDSARPCLSLRSMPLPYSLEMSLAVGYRRTSKGRSILAHLRVHDPLPEGLSVRRKANQRRVPEEWIHQRSCETNLDLSGFRLEPVQPLRVVAPSGD